MKDVQEEQIKWLENSEAFITKKDKIDFDGMPTLVVGVGGTGVDALVEVKHLFRLRFNPSKHIRFVGIDTDKKAVGKSAGTQAVQTMLDESSHEFINIYGQIAAIAKSDSYNTWPDSIKSFLKRDNDLKSAGADEEAGGVRLAGRTKLFASMRNIENDIEEAIRNIRLDAKTDRLRIFILTGISGGTGSGASLDIAYLIRAILKKRYAMDDPSYDLFGYLFMPDVNASSKQMSYLNSNAYAYLQEVEYLSSLVEIGETFRQEYINDIIYEGSDAPYKFTNLISSTGANNLTKKDAYKQSMLGVAESVMDFLTPAVEGNTDVTQVGNMSNNRARTVPHIVGNSNLSPEEKLMNRTYTSFGRTSFKMPTSEMLQYLTSLSFEFMNRSEKDGYDAKGMLQKFPSEDSYLQDLRAMNLTVEDFKNYLLDYHEMGETSEFSESVWSNSPAEVLKKYTYDAIKSKPDSIYAIVNKAVFQEVVDKKLSEITLKRYLDFQRTIERYLNTIRDAADKGPLYLARLFGFNFGGISSRSLLTQVDNLKSNLIEWEQVCNVQAKAYKTDADKKIAEETGLFGSKKNQIAKDTLSYFVESCVEHRHAKYCNMWISYLSELEEFLRKKRSEVGTVAEILYGILEISKINLHNVRNNITTEHATNEYLFATVPEMHHSLENGFAKINKDGYIESEFLNYLRENLKLLNSSETNEIDIPAFLQNFFSSKFSELINRKLEEIISWKAELKNNQIDSGAQLEGVHAEEEALKRYVGDEIVGFLKAQSSPMFPIKSPGSTANGELVKGEGLASWIKSPNGEENAALNKILKTTFKAMNGESSTFFESPDNRITQSSFMFGMPLYYYTQLPTMEYEYEKNLEGEDEVATTSHLFALDSNDWRELPNLTPYSVYQDAGDRKPSERIEKEHDERIKVFNLAVDNSVITVNNERWFLKIANKNVDLGNSEEIAFAKFSRMYQNYFATKSAVAEAEKTSQATKNLELYIHAVMVDSIGLDEGKSNYQVNLGEDLPSVKFLTRAKFQSSKYKEKTIYDSFLSTLNPKQLKVFQDNVESLFKDLQEHWDEYVIAGKQNLEAHRKQLDYLELLSDDDKTSDYEDTLIFYQAVVDTIESFGIEEE